VKARRSASRPGRVAARAALQLTHLGAAGWEITDGERVILLDPYLSRLRVSGQFGTMTTPAVAGDTRRIFGPDDELVPDPAAADRHVTRADFILHSHSHFNHTLDMPASRARRAPSSSAPRARRISPARAAWRRPSSSARGAARTSSSAGSR
jgi:L-ascorbate metabolism protein UlaG (beta-lactamase superfamily)